jgi:hypothetical protein
MKIENAKYTKNLTTNVVVAISATIDGQDWSVPIAVGNRHYDEIKKQVDAGELTIADAD